jgi:hypothetical protein
MAVIKISNKKGIDDLQAKLILQLGRKITQRETLDLCIQLANNKYEELLQLASDVPMLTPAIAKKILLKRDKYKNTYYNIEEKFDSENDNDAYSI